MRVPQRIIRAAVDSNKMRPFTVLPQNVAGSIVCDHGECAAARALKSQPGVVGAWVTRSRTFIEHSNGRIVRYQNPASLTRAVDTYDGTAGFFPPGDYVLMPVVGSNRKGERQRRSHTDCIHQRIEGSTVRTRARPMYALR